MSSVPTQDASPTAAVATDLPATVEGQSTAPSPTDANAPPDTSASLIVELADFAISLSAASIPTGEVEVSVNNTGDPYHNLLFIRTDLAPDALSTDEDGAVDETADGIEVVDRCSELPGGESEEIVTELPAGAYVLVCNVADEDGESATSKACGWHSVPVPRRDLQIC